MNTLVSIFPPNIYPPHPTPELPGLEMDISPIVNSQASGCSHWPGLPSSTNTAGNWAVY